MAFEVVEPGRFEAANALGEGEASLTKNGALTLLAEDLASVGIGAYAIVLADAGNLRIGLRAVRDGEQQRSVACSVIRRKADADSGRRRVSVRHALKRLGITAEAAAGRFTLCTHKDELLYITLSEGREIPAPQPDSKMPAPQRDGEILVTQKGK